MEWYAGRADKWSVRFDCRASNNQPRTRSTHRLLKALQVSGTHDPRKKGLLMEWKFI